ncbi:MAG: glycoside hydrolase family 3 C-terminal domain-containing protein [Lachnospiraceae bacterium]|nr:glycoside hydrolase family 3 C-terminal domain-containing protein [Lachnospiraceae bacterium]
MSEKLYDEKKFAEVARRAVAEGVVLIKNDKDVLPLQSGAKVALFGRSQYNYYKSGTGSGGMVNTKYVIGIKEALQADKRFVLNEKLMQTYDAWIKDHPFDAGQGWASEPWYQEEMQITEDIAKEAASESDVAVVLIGRTAGEDQDNSSKKGSYYLTDDEELMLSNVAKAFEKTVVLLNVGNTIDMKWVKKYNPASVAYVWQGGQVGGLGVVDVLSGDVNPSGRLTDTIAYEISDYPSDKNFGNDKRNVQEEDIYVGYRYFETFAPEKVLYPFGFGLSYTTFDIEPVSFEGTKGQAKVIVEVKNTGKAAGQQVVQLYLEKPQGKLGNPKRELVGFEKTVLLEPGQFQELSISVESYEMSSYDDTGVTGYKSAYVMEAGEYVFHAGENVKNTVKAGSFSLDETVVTCQLSSAVSPQIQFDRMRTGKNENGKYVLEYEKVSACEDEINKHRLEGMPSEIKYTGDKGLMLSDVYHGKCTMDDFIAQLSDEELMCIVRGEGMSSPKVTAGCGGAFGGVTEELASHGIPVACCSDGPSGIRMDSGKSAFAMPNGACLASTWNMDLLEELYVWEGLELRKNKIDVLLGPGMNIHRHPLNGRNFEYFSEDPLITGKCGAAELRGMHRYQVTGTIKHFALNTQEKGRHTVEHVASERAIREIYLKGYEIAVKEGDAHAVMTTYGPVNGYYSSSNYDLVTKILRDEWGFDGVVMTDWWAKGGTPEKNSISDMASIVKAQNDLYMVTADSKMNTNEDNSEEALKAGVVERAEYQRNAANICKFIMNKPVFLRYIKEGDEIDRQLAEEGDEEEEIFGKMLDYRMDTTGELSIDPSEITTKRGDSTLISVAIKERGLYKLSLDVRANAVSELAQIPLSIFKDKQLVKMITLTGEDKEWKTFEIDLGPCFFTSFLKLYFAQDGMELRNIKVSLTKSLEEEIRKRRES